jgi:hypothetical protein
VDGDGPSAAADSCPDREVREVREGREGRKIREAVDD